MSEAPSHPVVVDVGAAADLLATGRAVVTVPGDCGPGVREALEVLIVRTRRGLFAVESRCPHFGYRLAESTVRGRGIRCAGHGRRFDLRAAGSGRQARRGCLRTFEVWIEGERVLLRIAAG